MMKKFYFGMLLTAGIALGACSSDDREPEREPVKEPVSETGTLTETVRKTYTLTVNATKGVNDDANSATTRALTLDGKTLNASWATTEDVFVEGVYKGTTTYFWFQGSIKPQTAGVSTVLSGTISLPGGTSYSSIQEAIGTISVPLNLQFPRSGELDYTGQKGTLADIAANYDYATATINVDVDNDRIVVIDASTVKFENQQAIVKFTLKTSDGSALLSPTALTIKYGESNLSMSIPAETFTTNGAGVLFVAIPGDASKTLSLTATFGSDIYTYTFTKSGVTFDNGKYYAIGLKMKRAENNFSNLYINH